MKRTILLLMPVLIVSAAVGFLLYRGSGFVEEITVASGAQYQVASGEQYGNAGGDQYKVPQDIYYTRTVKSVVFSHQKHAVDLELQCNACHGGLFQMKAHAVEDKADFTMKGLADGRYCGSCHSGRDGAAFSSSTQCARCHIGVKGLERATGRQ